MKEHFRIIINDLRLKLVTIQQLRKKLNRDNPKDQKILHKLKYEYKEILDLFILYSMKRFDINMCKVK
jgi:hypothetical protein